jgi:hypothetical protein
VKNLEQFSERPTKPEIQDNAWSLIQRCLLPDEEMPLRMDEIIEEMESWNLEV